jgi:ACS family hexuronate transporter-like MFS transporter
VAPAIVPVIAAAWGWRAAFVLMGVVGLLWLLVWLPFYDSPEKVARVTRDELAHIRSDAVAVDPNEGRPMGWFELLRYRQAWSFIVAKFMTDPVWWFFLIWLPDFFKQTRGLDIKKSWVHLVVIYVIVTVLSIAGGWVAGWLIRRGYTVSGARKRAMLAFAACVVPIVLVTRAGDWTAVLLIGLAGAAHQGWSANLFTTTSDIFPKTAVASVTGLGGMAGSVGGILFPIYSGWLLDRFKASGNVTAGYAILFGICGSAYLLAFLINHLLATVFWRISQFVLRGAATAAALGIFSVGVKYLDGLNIIPSYFTMAIFPLMSRYAYAGGDSLVKAYRLAEGNFRSVPLVTFS